MPRTRTLALTTLLLLLTPAASAWPWDKTEVHVPTLREGDLLQLELDGGDERRLLLIEGPSRATDRFGIERATNAFREDLFEDGEYRRTVGCHEAQGTMDHVRSDILGGDPMGWSTDGGSGSTFSPAISGTRETEVNLTMTSFFGRGSCFFDASPGPITLREGGSYRLGDLIHEASEQPEFAEIWSARAEPAELAGRAALVTTFDITAAIQAIGELDEDVTEGTFTFTVTWADGIPVPVTQIFLGTSGGETEADRIDLTGYTPGTGAPLARAGGEGVPTRNPTGTFAPYDPLRIDTAAFDLSLSFEDAYAALRSDPRSGAQAWFGAHPDAQLQWASFGSATSESLPGMTETTPAWQLRYQDAQTAHTWMVIRRETIPAGIGAGLVPPQTTIEVMDFGETDPILVGQARPTELADASTMLSLARAGGMSGQVETLSWFLSSFGDGAYVTVRLDDVDRSGDAADGHGVWIDAIKGALDSAGVGTFRTTTTGGLLPPPSETIENTATAQGGALGALPVPTSLTSVAAAATGFGLFGLLLKFLLAPLFTRLVRARLLDNPVRARLYERVRAEPGIHRAELVDFAGIGEGATRHHLQQLVSHRMLVEIQQDKFARYFVAGDVPPAEARKEAILRAGSNLQVYELYVREPRLPLREAARRLDVSAPSVHRAKKKLEKAGLLPAAPAAHVAQA